MLTKSSRLRVATVATVLSILLVCVALLSSVLGQFSVPPDHVLGAVLRASGIMPRTEHTQLIDATLINIRFPRIMLGVLVGASLAVSGTVMQAMFGNPLAEPGVIGVSSGAAAGACLGIVTGVSFAGLFTIPLAAFLGALVTTFAVYILARSRGRAHTVTMILTGIAVTAIANALIAMLVFVADDFSRDQIVFWQMGSLNGATWKGVLASAPIMLIALIVVCAVAWKLDLLALGERAAQHSGLSVERLRMVAIVCTALLTGSAVAFSGIIASVGLIVPHVLRLLVGPSNRALIPLSAIGGALLVESADLAARTLVPYADLPIGIFTALVGGPLFFLLIRRNVVKGLGS